MEEKKINKQSTVTARGRWKIDDSLESQRNESATPWMTAVKGTGTVYLSALAVSQLGGWKINLRSCCWPHTAGATRSPLFFSVREVCLMQCDREAFIARRPWPTRSCCSRGKKWYPLTHQKPFGAGIFFKILAHSVFKMWILQESKKIALWNKRHLEEKKKRRMCSMFKILYICWVNINKYYYYFKCSVWRLAVGYDIYVRICR